MQINIFEELDSFLILEDLNSGDEDITGDLTLERRSDPDYNFYIVTVIVFALFHYLNY